MVGGISGAGKARGGPREITSKPLKQTLQLRGGVQLPPGTKLVMRGGKLVKFNLPGELGFHPGGNVAISKEDLQAALKPKAAPTKAAKAAAPPRGKKQLNTAILRKQLSSAIIRDLNSPTARVGKFIPRGRTAVKYTVRYTITQSGLSLFQVRGGTKEGRAFIDKQIKQSLSRPGTKLGEGRGTFSLAFAMQTQ